MTEWKKHPTPSPPSSTDSTTPHPRSNPPTLTKESAGLSFLGVARSDKHMACFATPVKRVRDSVSAADGRLFEFDLTTCCLNSLLEDICLFFLHTILEEGWGAIDKTLCLSKAETESFFDNLDNGDLLFTC